ncbi:radial spoke head 14 homolog [Limulus polyphemus]|uniref:Radial spoke head 14 homolog n=1 Tax=Limulus polyphemus TaxID=6850 RepID=A0ABM1BX78_LIMPO|nr:radial spoke head 14 homolog [Limulus polyphemus]
MVDTNQALTSNGMDVAIDMLRKSTSLPQKIKVTRVIMDLSVPKNGKQQACEKGAIPVLTDLLKEENQDIKAMALGALMLITVIAKGKILALEADIISRLLPLLHFPSPNVCKHCLKVLTMIAETPTGKNLLGAEVYKIEALMDNSTDDIKATAKKTIDVITWKP